MAQETTISALQGDSDAPRISNHEIAEALRGLQKTIGSNNAAKGFHEDMPDRADFVPGERGDVAFENCTRHYHGNLLMLIVSEAVEAHDEIRNGHAPTETYYVKGKPEGVPSEVADGIIRGLDYGHRHNIDIPSMVLEKISYNTTRPYKHGKKF